MARCFAFCCTTTGTWLSRVRRTAEFTQRRSLAGWGVRQKGTLVQSTCSIKFTCWHRYPFFEGESTREVVNWLKCSVLRRKVSSCAQAMLSQCRTSRARELLTHFCKLRLIGFQYGWCDYYSSNDLCFSVGFFCMTMTFKLISSGTTRIGNLKMFLTSASPRLVTNVGYRCKMYS